MGQNKQIIHIKFSSTKNLGVTEKKKAHHLAGIEPTISQGKCFTAVLQPLTIVNNFKNLNYVSIAIRPYFDFLFIVFQAAVAVALKLKKCK